MNIIPQIIWQISGGCTHDCWYCLSKYRNDPNYKELDEYLRVVDKLQNFGQRINIPKFNWKFKGGEPLQFPNLNILLRQVKTKPSRVAIETSAGESWFDILGIIDYLDQISMTHHYWQNETVVNYIADLTKERNISLKLIVPLLPGQIKEDRNRIQKFRDAGIEVNEQLLTNDSGGLIKNYSLKDQNIIYGRPEDWEPPPPVPPVPTEVDPRWVDPTISHGHPSFTGKNCWAGVDWLYISSKGFAKASDCGGRDIGNVFWEDWTPPDAPFSCPMMFCHSDNDRKNIRIES